MNTDGPPPISAGRLEHRLMAVVRKALGEHGMLSRGDGVMVGVSGGPDSMALLDLLVALSSRLSLRLAVAHLNHGLRPGAAEEDERFVQCTARRLCLPFVAEKIDVGRLRRKQRLSPEEAARKARYGFFRRKAAELECSRIALGHHADDNAEMVLMNLLRGSGPSGLAGIPPVRPLAVKTGSDAPLGSQATVIRPLIHATRIEIMDYLRQFSIAFRMDASNADRRYARNRIRHELLPLLRSSYNPNIVASLCRLSDIFRSENLWLSQMVDERYEKIAIVRKPGDKVSLPLNALCGIHPAVGRRLIRRAVAEVKGDLRRISFDHVVAVETLIAEGKNGASLDLPGEIRAFLAENLLIIMRGEYRPPSPEFCYCLERPFGRAVTLVIAETGDRLQFSETGVPDLMEIRRTGQRTAFFDINRVKFPLTVRNFRPGDRFAPLGMPGTQKVKKYFIDSGVPTSRRRRCPLLISGGEIIWIAGYRLGETARLEPATRRVLRAEVFLA